MTPVVSVVKARETVLSPAASLKKDFAAHFLFEVMEGYCTYFATAMTVLARSNNLPARYVEGFLADPQGQGSITLNGTNAHAWTEIYFPELGWVVFDATAQQGQSNNNNNNDNQGNQDPQSDPTPSPSPTPCPRARGCRSSRPCTIRRTSTPRSWLVVANRDGCLPPC